MNSYVVKQSLKHTISFCISVLIMVSFTIEQLDAQAENPLPLKHTKRIEFTTNEVTWMSLDVSPDGSTIVFEMLGDLYTLPVSGGKASQITRGSAFDSQPRYSPDGSKILFVSDRSGSENLWTLETGKTVTENSAVSETNGLQAITYGKNESFASPEWTSDGNYVIVSKASDAIWIDQLHYLWMYHVDGGSGTQLKADDQPIRALGAAFGPDNRYMYSSVSRPVQNGYPNQIEVYDFENGTTSRLTNLWGGAIRPTISPDGTWMVYASKNDSQTGYRLRNLVTGTDEWFLYPVQLDAQGAGEWISTSEDLMPGFSFTPDGTSIITSFDGKLYRVAVPSGAVTEISFEADVDLTITLVIRFDKRVPDGPVKARQIRYPSISPDGTKLLFTALHKLYIQDLKSGDISRLGEMEVGQYAPSWSHNGNWIAFVTWSDSEGGNVYKIDAHGRNLTKLSSIAGYFSDPVWTPDDEELIVTRGKKNIMYGLNVFSGRSSRELELVRIPARGGESVSIGPLHGVRPYFADAVDRFYVFERSGDLTSYQLDGTDRKVHFTISGSESSLTSGSRGASDVLMGPDGEQALVQTGPHIYKITLPVSTGGVMDLSLTDPTFPVEKLTTIGGQFMSWGPYGNEAVWSLGNTVFRYTIAESHNKSYEPIQSQINLEYPQRQGRGTLVLRGARILTMESLKTEQ